MHSGPAVPEAAKKPSIMLQYTKKALVDV